MICAYCTSRIPNGAVQCPACGARDPQMRVEEVVPTREIKFWPWVLTALGISAGFAFLGPQFPGEDDFPALWVLIPLMLWAIVGAPALLIRQAIRSGRAAGGYLLLKLALAVLLSPVCFIISCIGLI